jgi:hypothetical protein
MFPTSHDITPRFLRQSLPTITNLLRHNQVLIVSKPHLAVVRALCKELAGQKDKILFRFTIGSLKKSTCAFWEPGAPPPRERISALQHAFNVRVKQDTGGSGQAIPTAREIGYRVCVRVVWAAFHR